MNHEAKETDRKKEVKLTGVPSALKALEKLKHINLAVVYVQLEVGAQLAEKYGVDAADFYITPQWWDQNVGHSGTFEEMAKLFDKHYRTFVEAQLKQALGTEVTVGAVAEESVRESDETEQTESNRQEKSDEEVYDLQSNKSYELLAGLSASLAEAEENAIRFAEIVGYDNVEPDDDESFLTDLLEYIAKKYHLQLDSGELQAIFDHLKTITNSADSDDV